MKPTRDRRLWLARGAFCLLSVLVLSLPAQAIADGIVPGGVGEVVNEVTQTAGEVANEATQSAGEVANEATQSAGEVAKGTQRRR